MWIKICGNTRLEDCLLAAELGANAVGFVFAQGRRTVTSEQVAAMTAQLPPALEKIGVFTTQDADEIAASTQLASLTGVQLHGTYAPQIAADVRRRLASQPVRLVQVVHWDLDASAQQQAQAFAATVRQVEADALVDAILVDSCTAQASGGTGKTFDWAAAASSLQGVHMPVLVAGGLRPANVAAAIATLQPTGVDVSSGVERAPGIKDAEAMRSFIANARSQP